MLQRVFRFAPKAPKTNFVDGLYIVTCYYNPCRYKSRRKNYDIFMGALASSGIPVITIECAFGDDAFELPETRNVMRVRSNSLMWQKERLLNLAVERLPPECKYVAWVDCDILFMNPNWAKDTVAKFEAGYNLVQLFDSCDRLDCNHQSEGNIECSFGLVAPSRPRLLACGRYDKHGHTGYAWAIRREIIQAVGLYEYAIDGSADHYMAHAAYDIYGWCVEHSLKGNPDRMKHLMDWGQDFYNLVQGKVTSADGQIVHLWHGDLKHRRYVDRTWTTTALGFSPYKDLTSVPGQPLEWNPDMDTSKYEEFFQTHFRSRREDG